MEAPLRTVLRRIFGSSTSWKRSNRIPRSRRMFREEAEEEEFQYEGTRCLSSYYSVFVARLAIMIMLAILIGLLTVLTWHFTRVYTTKSINSLAYGLRFELLQRPIIRMWNTLNSTVEITAAQLKLSEYVIRRHTKPTTQAEQAELYESMRAVTWAIFASRNALTAITIKYKNGFIQAFHRDHRTNSTFYIYTNLLNSSITSNEGANELSSYQTWDGQSIHGNSSPIWYREPLDPDSGEKIGKTIPVASDDGIRIAVSQVPDNVASWHVAVSKCADSPLLSAALPVWDASHESIEAVVGVTTELDTVTQLMKELVEFHSGYIYLTSEEGYLLSTSTNAPLLMNSTTGPQLVMAIDSEHEVIRLGARWIQKAYGSAFPPAREVHVENARLGNQQYYIDSFVLNLKRLPMMGVIIIPRKYIMGKVDKRAFKTLIILISASVCILLIGCVCIMILTNGVSKEMKLRAELIIHLNARRRAEASNNYKSQFLANISHELRTPMAAVIGLLDILICDDSLTNEQYAMANQIRKCSTALLRLLNNILDISKIESGKLILEEAEFDLCRELEGLVDLFSVQCINHNVETVLDLSDDMLKLVRGDSARVVQIFANLISNSIKFTTSGHIILRGWCENLDTSTHSGKLSLNHEESKSAFKSMLKQGGNHVKKARKKENKIIVWFEVDDTGCGIDPSKWESVFESFEQADPSTTRTHGGTGLGLCIVRTLVNKMGGQIKVVKKNGPGTLMRLFFLLGAPPDGSGQHCQLDLTNESVAVLLALRGRMGRVIMSQWLRKHRVSTWEASDWHELTQTLKKLFQARISFSASNFDTESLQFTAELEDLPEVQSTIFIVVVDVGLLNLGTDTWKDQLNLLDAYSGKVKFSWMLNHDTSNAIKMELRRRGHLVMVNRPLYKAKMIQIIDDVIKDHNFELQTRSSYSQRTLKVEGDLPEFHEVDVIHLDASSLNDSEKSETSSPDAVNSWKLEEKQGARSRKLCPSQNSTDKNCVANLTQVQRNTDLGKDDQHRGQHNSLDVDGIEKESLSANNAFPTAETKFEYSKNQQQHLVSGAPDSKKFTPYSKKAVNEQKSLEGLRILLAEDTPVLQRVATIMLEKLGAKVIAVSDGLQAVDALECTLYEEECRLKYVSWDDRITSQSQSPFDLVLMDCQMPKMDGYEATKAIRKSEEGSSLHIPIVALTAHAMSSDEAKCLEVGMDAYLTKPIDLKLMVSTILSLTKRNS